VAAAPVELVRLLHGLRPRHRRPDATWGRARRSLILGEGLGRWSS
jgi:hypothetical protein